jgi:hypothetical protein
MKTHETNYLICCTHCGRELEIAKMKITEGLSTDATFYVVPGCVCESEDFNHE